VPNQELSLDNFRTIDAMVDLADRLTAADRRQPAELG
jgi:hypothetical protein